MAAIMTVGIVAFYSSTFLIAILTYGQALFIALCLLGVVVSSMVLALFVKEPKSSSPWKFNIILVALIAVAFAWHLHRFYVGYLNPGVTDVATTTLDAGHYMLMGASPYAFWIDRVAAQQVGPAYAGYKYLPIMAVVYLPLGQSLSVWGIYLTNLVLDCGVLTATYLLASRIGGTTSGLYSTLLYLVTPFVPPEIYGFGSTDLAAVLPLLVALFLVDRKKTLAGLCIGLSIATKLFPGLIVALFCLPQTRRSRYVGGVALGLLPIVPYAMLSPTEFFTNIVLYPLARSTDAMSWTYDLPAEYRLVGSAVLVIAIFSLAVVVLFKRLSPLQRCALAVVGIVMVILAGPGAHRNYELWWLPLFAVVVGTATLSFTGRCLGASARRVIKTKKRGRGAVTRQPGPRFPL